MPIPITIEELREAHAVLDSIEPSDSLAQRLLAAAEALVEMKYAFRASGRSAGAEEAYYAAREHAFSLVHIEDFI
jgi:hypothetical protein